jgi:hypothetical protein
MSMWSWFEKAFDVGAAYAEATPLRLVKPIEAPSREEFEAWRDDDVTRFVMASFGPQRRRMPRRMASAVVGGR